MALFSVKNLLMGVAVLLVCGCSIINPYNENFACKNNHTRGQCVGTQIAYKAATGELQFADENVEDDENHCSKCEVAKQARQDFAKLAKGERQRAVHKEYMDAVYARLTGLLKKPETPMVEPPRIMRVLILPYEDRNNVLFMPRYTYLKVEDSKWVVGDYLVNGLGEE